MKAKQVQLRPFLIKIKLKLKALAVKYRPRLRPLPVDQFYAKHWRGDPPKSDYFVNRTSPTFFFKASDKTRYANVLQNRFPDSVNKILGRAENALSHTFDLLGSGPTKLGNEMDWHTDFKSGFKWPREHYSKIQIVDLSNNSDVKIPWELSRLQHLVTLGQANWLTDDIRYTTEFVNTITQWNNQNPIDIGVNWTCSMEIAIRAINIIWGLHFFARDNQLSDESIKSTIKLLYYHAVHIERNLEEIDKGSNTNHLLSNYLGLFYIGLLFPEFDNSKKWLDMGKEGLEEEILLQVNDEGADYECSMSYHRLVLEMFLQALVLGQKNEIQFSADYQSRLQSMIEFSVEMTGQSGLVPSFGDNDDGFIIKLDNDNPHDHRHLIDIGAHLYAVKVPKEVVLSSERLWYLGLDSLNRWPSMTHRKPKLFKKSGYLIVQNERMHLALNACGISEKAFGGHKHNDLLSICLEIDSEPILIDSGAACYTSDFQKRNQSRATLSHNTISIDDEEQQRFLEKALFFMFQDANPKIDLWTVAGDKVIVSAYHDGYKRIADDLKHRRTIESSLNKREITIIDEVSGRSSKEHLFKCNFITPFHCQLLKDGNSAIITSPRGKSVCFNFESDAEAHLKCEATEHYPTYGVTKPASKLTYISRCKLPFNLTTRISHKAIIESGNRIEFGSVDITSKDELLNMR